jgi:hypothetical protein
VRAQPLTELSLGQPEAGFGGAFRDAQQFGEFPVGVPLQVGHLDCLSLLGRQAGNGLTYKLNDRLAVLFVHGASPLLRVELVMTLLSRLAADVATNVVDRPPVGLHTEEGA